MSEGFANSRLFCKFIQIYTVVRPAAQIITSVPAVYGVWNLASKYNGAYFLSFLQTSLLFL